MNYKNFKSPPPEFREIPFWSWNDRLDKEELRRQIRLIAQGGWGGFFIHSRTGLQTSYLGSDWLECVRISVVEARKLGLQAWLYDEDKWPSGFAGGMSVASDPQHRAKCLVCKVDDRPNLLAERIAIFHASEIGGVLQDFQSNPAPAFNFPTDRLVQFYPLTASPGNPTFNDYTYVDLLNSEAVRAFLDSTHERYARSIGDEFGKTIPGMFTDEPCFQFHSYVFGEFGWQASDMAIPWTTDLPETFQAQNGYDLLPHLPSLFFDTGDFRSVRYDYYKTVTGMFLERYTRQVAAWCETHSLQLTGHLMGEDTMLWQIPWVGSVMPHMAEMHIPGVDKLGRSVNSFDSGMLLTMKQLDSVVCQTGKERALCEIYGCAGQDFAHTGRKWIGDWAHVLGINLNNPHLALYSMRGERKRDCPPNLFFQQPWWPENHLISDYFARLSYLLSQGQRKVDILVIHPIGSAWTEYRPGAASAVIRLDRALNELMLQLMQTQHDYHLADESLMETGSATEAHVSTETGTAHLVVGKMLYQLVIVPPSITITNNTSRLLAEFAAAGGVVLAVTPLPTLLDGRPANVSVLPNETLLVSIEDLPAVLDQKLPFDVQVTGYPSIWVHHRTVEGRQVYFLANIDPDHAYQARVFIRGQGQVESWDAASGSVHELPIQTKGGLTEISLDFPPAGSHLIVIDPEKIANLAEGQPELPKSQIVLPNRWNIRTNNPNALVLDRVKIRLDDREWSSSMHILEAQQAAARAGTGTKFELAFSFEVAEQFPGTIHLVMETPEKFQIQINEQPLDICQIQGWWVDPAFQQLDITRLVINGKNSIFLCGQVTRDTELESITITGNFGVNARHMGTENQLSGQVFDRYRAGFQLTLPSQLAIDSDPSHTPKLDLTSMGFPFFAGRITLEQQIHIPAVMPYCCLEIEGLHAALVQVKVNGLPAGSACWPNHRINIFEQVCPGENTIEIEIVGTLRNLLGPHHLVGGDPYRTNPEDFHRKDAWTDDYILTPFGWDHVRMCW